MLTNTELRGMPSRRPNTNLIWLTVPIVTVRLIVIVTLRREEAEGLAGGVGLRLMGAATGGLTGAELMGVQLIGPNAEPMGTELKGALLTGADSSGFNTGESVTSDDVGAPKTDGVC